MNVLTFLQINGFLKEVYRGPEVFNFLHKRHYNAHKTMKNMINLGIIYTSNSMLRRNGYRGSYVCKLNYDEACIINWSDVAERYSFFFIFHSRLNYFFRRRQKRITKLEQGVMSNSKYSPSVTNVLSKFSCTFRE
uniref:SCP domain-containing protein n=1 Tax=Heterorhabditis bacteriophora TaxID=37862 RepID=A0A1I7WGC5_HETBA